MKSARKPIKNTRARREAAGTPSVARERVLAAAYAAFTEHGYDGASTLEIASRANVSKRELYALFRSKEGMLTACIAERAQRMRRPLAAPTPTDKDALAAALAGFGAATLRGVSDPKVLALHRLAIAEARRLPGIAEALEANARQPNRAALTALFTDAQARGLIGDGSPATMAREFLALLWGDLLMQLLLGVAAPPGDADIAIRAKTAAEQIILLHPA